MAREHFFQDLAGEMGNRSNGVFFITTGGRRSITLALTDGWITYCSGIREHGQAAIAQLLEVDIVSHKFTEGADFPFRSRDEVVHDAAVATLRPALGEIPAKPRVVAAETGSPPTAVGVKTRIYRGRVVED